MAESPAKIVLLGMASVGKTTLVERYRAGCFKERVTATVGAAFVPKEVHVDGTSVQLAIWDTAGADRYESMSRMYYREAVVAIVCHDLTVRKSFEKVKFWVDELKSNVPKCHVFIVGTKLDLVQEGADRAVAPSVVEEYASSLDARVWELSAKTGENVDEVFEAAARVYLSVAKERGGPTEYKEVKHLHEPTRSSKQCC